MGKIITTNDIQNLIINLNNGGISEAINAYNVLYNSGLNYAGWAQGVASGNSITGQAALHYLDASSMMGLGGNECLALTPDQINKIRMDMAKATLEEYNNIAGNTGVLNRDFTYDEIKKIHQHVFENNNLSLDNWTLHIPMEVIRRRFGDNAVESAWSILRDTGGNGAASLLASEAILELMLGISVLGTADEKQKAQEWLKQFDNPSSWGDIISKGLDDDIKSLQGALDNLIRKLQELLGIASKTTSPLILDLDGDGVETLAQSAYNVYFDHDANGFAELSGWVATDDGLLVRDINGNGKIDSGRELFGNNTLLANGQLAENGFTALIDLDSNYDGVINAADTAFNSLRVWKDTNSNGITDEGELLTMTQAGVQSISTSYIDKGPIGTEDAQGNQHRQTGSYTNAQGQTQTITDVWFNTDKARTLDKNTVALSAAILALPELGGMGNVPSLRQAMARDTSGALRSLIERFIAEAEPNAQVSLVTDIIYAWAGVTNIDPLSRSATQIYGNAIGDARKLEALEEFLGQEWTGTWCWGTADPNPHGHAAPILLRAFDMLKDYVYAQLMQQKHIAPLYDSLSLAWDETSSSIVFDVTNTVTLLQSKYATNPTNTEELMHEFGGNLMAQGIVGRRLLDQLHQAGDITGQGFKFTLATLGYAPLIGDSANNYINGTNNRDFLQGNAGDDSLIGNSGNDTLIGGTGNDSLDGGYGSDTYLFNKGDGHDTISDMDWESYYGRIGDTDILKLGAGLTAADTVISRVGNDLRLSWGTADSVTIQDYYVASHGTAFQIELIEFADGTRWLAQNIADRLTYNGTDADDTMHGTYNYANRINGGSGNDFILGGNLADALKGEAGNDTLSGSNGNDTLIGGTGNDSLDGGFGSDTYIFNKGDGHDTISDMDWERYYGRIGDTDILKLGAGLAVADTVISRVGNDLKLSWGTADSVTIQDYYVASHGTAFQIELIEFADGTRWLAQDIADRLTYNGTDADDVMFGTYNYANRINGDSGNDFIHGGDLADALRGEAGNDTLSGSNGNDTLIGGTGNDFLDGEYGSDTYIFNKGDGHDTISDMDWERYYGRIGDTDILKLGAGLAVADTVISRVGNDLKLSWGTADSVTIQDYYLASHGTAFQIEQIEFADGTRWLAQDIADKLTYNGTDADDYLYGSYNYANRINGGDGNDFISGGSLDDVLKGDAGNDTLMGGSGNDTYLFGRGSGADVISDYDSTSDNADKVSISAGVSKEQLWFRQVGNDLEMSIIGTQDKTTISDWYSGSSYRVESFNTSSGSALLENQVDALVSAMAAFAPPAPGQTSLPANYQATLNSVIAASWQ